jgi:hypothetical protein
LLKVSLGFCFQQDFEQNFFGNSASFPANPLCSIDAAQRSSNLIGREERAVGGYIPRPHVDLRSRSASAKERSLNSPTGSDAGKKPATKMFFRNSVPLAL